MTVTTLVNTDAISYMQENENSMLLHIVNCQGVMGSGIAAQIKERIPEAFDVYKESYDEGKLLLGSVNGHMGILNLAAQDNYGRDKRHLNYGALAACLSLCFQNLDPATEIVAPYKMGCDRAGGDWGIVLEMLDFFFRERYGMRHW